MVKYEVCMNNSSKAVFTTSDLIKARKVAVLKLIEADKKVQWADIYKNEKWFARISMQIGSDEYIKPSVGLKKGYDFLYDDYYSFRAVYLNGRLGEFNN